MAPALAVLALTLCAYAPAGADGGQTARMDAGFSPERLGRATTVSLGFHLAAAGGSLPAALSGIDLAYPPNIGLSTSDLGVAECSPGELEALGDEVCPANSRMGSGSAEVEIRIGPTVVEETVALGLFAGPSPDGYLHVLVYASGVFPVYAQVVLTGVLLPGRLSVAVPPIPSLPAAPNVVVMEMRLTLGGALTYYEQVGGRSVAYHPAGVGLPARCPAGGFGFAATFAFVDGSRSNARTAVPCPRP